MGETRRNVAWTKAPETSEEEIFMASMSGQYVWDINLKHQLLKSVELLREKQKQQKIDDNEELQKECAEIEKKVDNIIAARKECMERASEIRDRWDKERPMLPVKVTGGQRWITVKESEIKS